MLMHEKTCVIPIINLTPNNTNNLKVMFCLKQLVVVYGCYYKGAKVVKNQGSYWIDRLNGVGFLFHRLSD